jgi:hypothetical protein
MKPRLWVLIIFCAAWLFLYNVDAMSASASAFIGGTNVLTLAGPPLYCTNEHPDGCFTTTGNVYVYYRDNLNVTVTGFVYWVVHNGIGQTVAVGEATVLLEPGVNDTANVIIFGLVPGTSYNSAIFVTAPGGVAISNSTSLAFTIPNQ